MARGELGVHRVCCMLHSLNPGGSSRQWVHLLGRHVAAGGAATILAPPGPLSGAVEALGVELLPTIWEREEAAGWCRATEAAGRSGLVVVHWDHEVMHAYGPALESCGRAALIAHQSPLQLLRWFEPRVMVDAQAIFNRAARERSGFVFVRGVAHRRQFEHDFDVPAEALRILPASIPLPTFTAGAGTGEILALTRHSPEKASIPELAVELTRRGLDRGQECRLTVAGNGPRRKWAEALCAERLPPSSWRFEPAPEDSVARLGAADIVVAQGLTTLEAAALGRRVVVARGADAGGAEGVVLRPALYEEAARDPFGEPKVTSEIDRLWEGLLALEPGELRALRKLVEADNTLDAAASAVRAAIAATPRRRGLRRTLRRRLARTVS